MSSMFERTVLDNGLRVVTSTLPHTHSASLSFFVGAGSRYEADEQAGVSHFLEHMLFKGTRRRPTPREISEEIEGVGGVMNAATDKELTVYWAKVGHQHFERAMDVLADNLLHSRFAPREIEKERQVIFEELAMTEDNPGELVGLLIDEVVWPNQALGRDVGGSPATVRRLSRATMRAYLHQQYVPENTVLAAAGNVTHQQVVESARKHLTAWSRAPFGTWQPAVNGQAGQRVRIRHKQTEQAHLCLALPAYSSDHPDRYALDVLNTVLGEGMSSRLFLEIREKRALAYDVHSYVNRFVDTGSVVVGASVEPKKAAETIRVVHEELQGARKRIPEDELTKAREYMKGRLQLRMEDTGAVAAWLGRQELLKKQILTVDEVLQILDAVTAADLERVAHDLFKPESLNLAVVGPFKSAARFEAALR
jgi:predicted Zn-dependent peptidase